MSEKLAQIINYLISIGLLIFILGVLERKSRQQPGFTIFGQSFKTISSIIFVVLGINLALILFTLFS